MDQLIDSSRLYWSLHSLLSLSFTICQSVCLALYLHDPPPPSLSLSLSLLAHFQVSSVVFFIFRLFLSIHVSIVFIHFPSVSVALCLPLSWIRIFSYLCLSISCSSISLFLPFLCPSLIVLTLSPSLVSLNLYRNRIPIL